MSKPQKAKRSFPLWPGRVVVLFGYGAFTVIIMEKAFSHMWIEEAIVVALFFLLSFPALTAIYQRDNSKLVLNAAYLREGGLLLALGLLATLSYYIIGVSMHETNTIPECIGHGVNIAISTGFLLAFLKGPKPTTEEAATEKATIFSAIAQNNFLQFFLFLLGDRSLANSTMGPGGWTPLHTAASWGRMKMAEYLLAKGAKVNASDNAGMTPLDVAMSENQHAMADYLRAHGGVANLAEAS